MELGGPNYSKVARITDQEGNELGGATGRGAGYKYFGAAKQLPGVRELFEKEAPRYTVTIVSCAAQAKCWLKLHVPLLAGNIRQCQCMQLSLDYTHWTVRLAIKCYGPSELRSDHHQ